MKNNISGNRTKGNHNLAGINSGTYYSIEGNHNIQAGRDIHIHYHSPAYDDLLTRYLDLLDKYTNLLEERAKPVL